MKRFIDFVIAALCLVVFSPLILACWLAIKIGGGPAIYRQERIGRGGRPFYIYKFRSMVVDAEKEGAELLQQPDDPRLTRIGRFLRAHHLDELPQLWNVLRGDMSLIGPRPEIPFFVEQFRETVPLYMVKNQVRPGITGWAQVNGFRGDTSIPKRIEHDIWYIENWSFGLDIRIIFRTIFGGMINRESL